MIIQRYWLRTTGEDYWTMTPSNYNDVGYARVFYVSSYGAFSDSVDTNNKFMGSRPVINLKSSTTFESNGADGSAEKPYVVKI